MKRQLRNAVDRLNELREVISSARAHHKATNASLHEAWALHHRLGWDLFNLLKDSLDDEDYDDAEQNFQHRSSGDSNSVEEAKNHIETLLRKDSKSPKKEPVSPSAPKTPHRIRKKHGRPARTKKATKKVAT